MNFAQVKQAYKLTADYERLQASREKLKKLIGESLLPSSVVTVVGQNPKGKNKGETDMRLDLHFGADGTSMSLGALLGVIERVMDTIADDLRKMGVGDA